MKKLEPQLSMLMRISRHYSRFSGCNADELLNCAVLEVLEHIDRFDASRGSFAAFCRVWGTRGIRLAVRRSATPQRSTDEDVPDNSPLGVEDLTHLWRELRRLSEVERRVLALRFAHELTQHEVARQLGVSRDAVVRIERSALRSMKTT